MKRFRSTRRSMARNDGLESDPKYFDHVSHPLNNVAKAATNNDRPACIVIELRLFVIVIIQILRAVGKLARGHGDKGEAKIPIRSREGCNGGREAFG